MKLKKIRRKIIIALSGSAILILAIVLGALVYIKLFGLKTALEELVHAETGGKYALTIGKANVDFRTLSFAFDSLTITRDPSQPETGIRQVKITRLKLQVAKLGAMFRSKKYDIKTLIIDEPLIQIDNHKKEDLPKEKFHLGQQIVKLYPAIESVLGRFNIEHLKISRASLGINNHPKPPLTLSLVDFLIEAWDENQLSKNSQLQLIIGEQELRLEKAAFSFSGIEYNLRKHQLTLDDVTFGTVDSLTNSHVEVAAESLILSKLGYHDLFENQKLTYEKVTVLNPVVDLHLIIKKNVASEDLQKANGKEVLTRIIKQSIGECSVDTVVIQNASVSTILQKDQDSTSIEVPEVNFTMYTFLVSNDSTTFYTGSADIELNKTSIKLTDDYILSCNKLMFDRDRNLFFEDVEIYDMDHKMVVIDCQSLQLTGFHLLPLMFDKALLIETVRLKNAVVNVPSGKVLGTRKKNKNKGLEEIDIKKIALANVTVKHNSPKMQLLAKGVSLDLSNVTKLRDTELVYSFRDIMAVDAQVNLIDKKTNVHLHNVGFDGTTVNARMINLNQRELNVALTNVAVVHSKKTTNFKDIDYENWQSITVEKARIEGKLPEKRENLPQDSAKSPTAFSVKQIAVRHLTTSVSNNDLHILLTGKDLVVANAGLVGGVPEYKSIAGKISDIKVTLPEAQVDIAGLDLALPHSVTVHKASVKKEETHISFALAKISSLKKGADRWSLRKASFGKFVLTKSGHELFLSDSILAENINFGGKAKPTIAHIEVFKPKIQLPENEGSAKATKAKPNLAFLEQLNAIDIHPGVLVLPNKNELAFGKTHVKTREKAITCAYLRTEVPKFSFNIEGIGINKELISIETFNLKPSEHWLKTYPYEAAVLHANMYSTKITGYNLDSLLLAGKFHHADVSVGSYYIHARRDHTLPDAPYAEKPFSLSSMLKLPPNIRLNSLKLANGKIDVEQVSDKTGKTGTIDLTDVWANATLKEMEDGAIKVDLIGGALLCGQGKVDLTYTTYNADIFILQARLTDFDLTKLNPMVLPLQAIEIKSGYLQQYDYTITANNLQAVGDATITYKNLHLTIYKRGTPEEKNLGSELLTLVADGLVLKNSKKNAPSVILQQRDKEKATFQYWVASAIQGAMNGIRQGKSKKK
jgi:hypothetical protein